MTDKNKIEKIISLLTDTEIFKQCDKGLITEDERLGVMIFCTEIFNKARRIQSN